MKKLGAHLLGCGFLTALMLSCQPCGAAGTGKKVVRPKPAPVAIPWGLSTTLAQYQWLAAQNPTGNCVFSPFSFDAAMLLVASGAAGESHQALQSVFNYSRPLEAIREAYQKTASELAKPANDGVLGTDIGPTISIANSVWARPGLTFQKSYLDAGKVHMAAEAFRVDFRDPAASVKIDEWIKSKTAGKITGAGPVDHETWFMLINALYFKARWQCEFDPGATSECPFYVEPTVYKLASTMHEERQALCYSGPGYAAICLPYRGETCSMYFFLPERSSNLAKMESTLAATDVGKLPFNETLAEIALPRFTIEQAYSLKNYFVSHGLGGLFEPGKANFANMFDGHPQTFLMDVKQALYLRVDEAGTEAAAATTGSGGGAAPCRPFQFVADRPFAFVLRHNASGRILFAGHVCDPVPEEPLHTSIRARAKNGLPSELTGLTGQALFLKKIERRISGSWIPPETSAARTTVIRLPLFSNGFDLDNAWCETGSAPLVVTKNSGDWQWDSAAETAVCDEFGVQSGPWGPVQAVPISRGVRKPTRTILEITFASKDCSVRVKALPK